jgi:nucleoside-diphosphate-sugar epimerase
VVRPKTFLGPGRVSAFALLFDAVRRGQPVLVLGRGDNRYQLLDVRDLADGLARLRGIDAAGVFGFGAADFRTVREDFQALLGHARTGAHLRFVPAGVARLGLRAMEVAGLVPLAEWHYRSARGEDSVVDIARARDELGWHPVRSNARMLVEAYDWYVGCVASRGAAPTTHRVPLTHRVLGRLGLLLPR